MRQITQDAIEAFNNRQLFRRDNTSVTVEFPTLKHCSIARLYLHGNCIAIRDNNKLSITMAGWPTVTTGERLNGLEGVSLHQSKGEQFLNDSIIDDDKWYVINQE